jgi:hypothetical protein
MLAVVSKKFVFLHGGPGRGANWSGQAGRRVGFRPSLHVEQFVVRELRPLLDELETRFGLVAHQPLD